VFAYVLRRILLMIPTTLGVALVVFLLYHAAPGDPAIVMLGAGGGGEMSQDSDVEARIDAFRRKHGLDRSLAVQFLNYIGPFNLMRDGHPWFSSPYTERKTTQVELDDGTVLSEGVPLAIEAAPGTAAGVVERSGAAAGRLRDPDAGEEEWSAAADELATAGRDALPALLTVLHDLRLDPVGGAAAIARVSEALTRCADPDDTWRAALAPVADAAGRTTLVRRWFGWYYTHGGDRVRNSGERSWGGLLCLDLGDEMQRKTSVAEELVRRLRVTVSLALVSILLSYLIALPLGIFSVRSQGTRLDAGVTVILFVLYSIPSFWAGLMLQLTFGATGFDLLPVIGLHDVDAGRMSTGEYAWDLVKHGILPVATMTYGSFAYLSRQMRAGMLEVIGQDYIRTARAKGLSERVVIYKHALRNSLIPVITLFASILPILVGGSIIVEAVFDVPGMGQYAYVGLLRRDFYIVMATTIFVGIMTQLGILLSDVTYSLVDPRIRYD